MPDRPVSVKGQHPERKGRTQACLWEYRCRGCGRLVQTVEPLHGSWWRSAALRRMKCTDCGRKRVWGYFIFVPWDHWRYVEANGGRIVLEGRRRVRKKVLTADRPEV